MLHELPGLIYDQEATFLLGADHIPDVAEHDIHGHRAKFILEIANIENHHRIIDVDIGLLGENTSKGARSVFAQTLGQLWARAAHMRQGIIEMDDGGWSALVSQRITGDASAGIGINQCLVEIGLLVGSQSGDDLTIWSDLVATEHQAEEAMQSDEVGTEGVIGVLTIDDFGQVEGVDADVGIEAETDITATHGVAKALIFILGVDNQDFGTNHHGADSFELDREGFTSTRFGEDHEVGVFQAEAVKNH